MKTKRIQLYRWLVAAMLLAITVTACEDSLKLPSEVQNNADGSAQFVMSLEEADFAPQLMSRADDATPLIATSLETRINNAYAFVFTYPKDTDLTDAETDIYSGVLSQCIPAIRTTIGDETYYLAQLESESVPTLVIGAANITASVIDEVITNITTMGITDSYTFANFKEMAGMVYVPDDYSTVLKKGSNAMLPLYTSALLFNTEDSDGYYFSQSAISAQSTPAGYFEYARIDVKLDSAVDSEITLVSMQATNVRYYPWGEAGDDPYNEGETLAANASTESHVVTPATNEQQSSYYAQYPDGITDDNYQTRYVQGLYIHPTSEAPTSFEGVEKSDFVTDENTAEEIAAKCVEVVIGVNKSAAEPTVYYKIRLKYTHSYGANTGEYPIYDLYSNNRYLINITSINSPGYPSYDEAKAAPASNTAIDFNITVDGDMSSFTSNGQYYLAVETENYWARGNSSESPMLYPNPSIDSFDKTEENCNNVDAWSYDETTGLFTLTVKFTLNDGDGNLVSDDGSLLGILTCEINDIPDGISINPEDVLWYENFGEYEIDLLIDPTVFSHDEVTIRVGELTRSIQVDINTNTVTDYTDNDIVEELTGLTTGVSNCYILVPAEQAIAVYYLPVIERVNEYWGNSALYGNSGRMTIDANIDETAWANNYAVTRLWHDGEADDSHRLIYELTNSPAGKPSLKVTVPANYQNQNVGVKLTDKGGNDIYWSWHLWVTDYNPYINISGTPIWRTTGLSAYQQVPGGDGSLDSPYAYLHRYRDHTYDPFVAQQYFLDATVWSGPPTDASSTEYLWYLYKGYSGYNESIYIMDRNIGAIEATYEGQGNSSGDGVIDYNYDRGILCYQFGRKDPFPGRRTLDYHDDEDATFIDVNSTSTMENSIQNPMNFYFRGEVSDWAGSQQDWNQDNIDNSLATVDYLWNDPSMVRDINALSYNQYCVPYIRTDKYTENATPYTGYTAGTSSDIAKAKSIYDPSPLGWCVPVDGTWNDFDLIDVLWTDRGGEYTVEGGIKAYYPAQGYIYGDEGSGNFGSGEVKGFYWSSAPSVTETNKARYMLIQDGAMQPVLSAVRSNGYPVRPVMERPTGGYKSVISE